jgi:opacity protein-like surface antigen
MRSYVVAGLGAATLAIAQPVLADNVTYLGLRGSYAYTEETEAEATGFVGDVSFDHAFAGSVLIGKFLGPDVRIEGELMFAHSESDDFQVTQDTVNIVPLTGQTFPLSGDVDVIAPMFNVLLELPIEGTSIDLYYGGGVGGAHLDVNASSAAAGIAIDDDAWAFAYQFMAGATAPIADGVEGQLGYRYFGTTDFTVDDPVLGDFDMNLTNHHVEIGLLFRL